MRIMVTGAQGQVGWELARSLMPLGEVHALERSRCDLAQPERLAALIGELAPDVIVNAAAYTAVDRAEEEEALATRINGSALEALGEAARQQGALVIHYSTDYVLDGRGDAPHAPDEAVAPLNAYGRSKLVGEEALRDSGADHLIFRTTWVYGARGRNFLLTMLRLAAERDVLRVVADQIGAPTWSRNIADATAHIVRLAQAERRAGSFASGLFNLTNAGATSWHGFAEAILAEAQVWLDDFEPKAARVEAIASEAFPTPARRPANSRMDGRSLRERFELQLPDWREALRACLADMGCATRPWASRARV